MHAMADCAATLGSRFNLIFDPHGDRLYHNAYGQFREQALALTVGVQTPSGELWRLPFGGGGQVFPYLEQHSTLTTIEYRGVHPGLWIEFVLKVRAPFYPQDAKISTAPVYYVDLTVRALDRWRWSSCDEPLQQGEIIFALAGEGVKFAPGEGCFRYAFPSTSEQRSTVGEESAIIASETMLVRSAVSCLEGEAAGPVGMTKPFDLRESKEATLSLLWSSWSEQPALEVHGEATPFKYHEFFTSEERMLTWAQKRRPDIEKRCEYLDGLFRDWSLGRATSNLSALALHSFLANSWWTTRRSGEDWFSVWEGSCYFHSTVDVEYNDALLYFALWPELLDMLLEQWADFQVDGRETIGPQAKGASFLSHDMGSHTWAGKQVYPHHMEVEENANYLLMLAARAFFTGDLELARRQMPTARKLAEFIVQADTDGTGFPDVGVANTIDDATPALQYGKEQVYLAVKSQAALWAMAQLEGHLFEGEQSKAERWKAFVAKGVKTLNEKGWVRDHYAVTLDRTTEGLTDPWSGEELPEGELEGWDAYSIYTSNGLLYLFLANLRMPRWKLARFAEDIETAELATRTPYGSSHTSAGQGIVWISQNLWRDYVAAYLGIDLLNSVDGYWDYQALTGENADASLYYDTTSQNNLNFYPRGATVFGAPLAAAGMRLNRAAGELGLAPVRGTLRVPLLPLADWEKMRAPWLIVRSREGVAVAQITEPDLLKGLTVRVTGAELETA